MRFPVNHVCAFSNTDPETPAQKRSARFLTHEETLGRGKGKECLGARARVWDGRPFPPRSDAQSPQALRRERTRRLRWQGHDLRHSQLPEAENVSAALLHRRAARLALAELALANRTCDLTAAAAAGDLVAALAARGSGCSRFEPIGGPAPPLPTPQAACTDLNSNIRSR